MSDDDRRSVRDLSKDHSFCRKNAFIQPPREVRVLNGSNDDSSAPSPSSVPPPDNLAFAPANVTNYVDRFGLLIDTWRLATMPRDGDRL